MRLNKYGVKCGTSLRFWENKGCINEMDPYGWFQWYFSYWLGRRLEDDERQINRSRKIVSRFRGMKWNEKTLKFSNIRVNKKYFHKSKQSIDLDSIKLDQIVVSDKFKDSDDGFKYFIGYKEGEIVKALCMILPLMRGYIKYFEKEEKICLFLIKDDDVLDKYNEIWDKVKNKLNIKFHSMSVYETYIKAKVLK